MKSICFLLAIVAAIVGWNYLHRPIVYPAGVLISSEPQQTTMAAEPIAYGRFELKPLAHFALDARVLHRKIYRWDRQASLVPVDLALGWGRMSDQQVLDRLKITQSMRFFWYEWRTQPPIPEPEIISHSLNLHVIPATAEIAKRCKSLRAGTLVHLSGDLVEATAPRMGAWRSSLSRTDTGNGACELMWVTDVAIMPEPPTQDRQLLSRR